MSGAGYFNAQAQQPDQMTPQQKMAMAMMGQSYNPQQQNAGIANAGSSLAGALAMKNIADNQKWAAQGITPVKVTPQVGSGIGGWLQNAFGMGGGS